MMVRWSLTSLFSRNTAISETFVLDESTHCRKLVNTTEHFDHELVIISLIVRSAPIQYANRYVIITVKRNRYFDENSAVNIERCRP